MTSARSVMRMTITLSRLLVILLFSVCSTTQSQSSNEGQVKAFLDQVDHPVVYSVPGMDRAMERKDLVYGKDASVKFLRMDLYTPADTKVALPVVVLIHGGVGSDDPLRPKDWGFYKSWGRLIAASGMAPLHSITVRGSRIRTWSRRRKMWKT